ncbi:MAG: hypothetical protein HFG26_06800 [Provencibacterium sp.]|jgi:hypothetical protein|nr:hypothetical protein [Provencibacterium sp.]
MATENPSGIRLVQMPRQRIALYLVISPAPEYDVSRHMEEWALQSGLLEYPDFSPRVLGWDFPLVSKEQSEQFGLRGYVSCYTVPASFEPACPGAQLDWMEADEYAVLRLKDPFAQPDQSIPAGWNRLHSWVEENGLNPHALAGRYCFEEVVREGDITYMDLYHPVH